MNIAPEKVVKTTASDGTTFLTEIYSFDAYRENTFLKFIVIAIVAGLIAPGISALLLLFFCIDVQRKPIVLNIIGILVPIYLLIDIHNGWIISLLMSLFFDDTEYRYVIYLNGGMILAHLICLIEHVRIYNLAKENKMSFFLSFLVISIVCYFISFLVISNNIIEIQKGKTILEPSKQNVTSAFATSPNVSDICL